MERTDADHAKADQVRMVWVLQAEPPRQRGGPQWYSHAHWTKPV
jgi:hypothetical protein